MGLLDLVEKQERERTPLYGICELTTLFIAHISWRCPNQALIGVFVIELRHIKPETCLVVAEQELRERFRKLSLSNAGWANEK
jgi:hypothetical protein